MNEFIKYKVCLVKFVSVLISIIVVILIFVIRIYIIKIVRIKDTCNNNFELIIIDNDRDHYIYISMFINL